MKLRMVGFAALLLLAPVGAQAQVDWPCCRPLNKGMVDQLLPLVQAEAASANTLNAKLEQLAMMKSTYIAGKNTLMVAKLDAADASRLKALPFDDGSRKRREANVLVYRANKARIDAALRGLNADPECGLCAPKAAGATTTRP